MNDHGGEGNHEGIFTKPVFESALAKIVEVLQNTTPKGINVYDSIFKSCGTSLRYMHKVSDRDFIPGPFV